MINIIRAIPQWCGQGEQYFDIGDIPWKEQTAFRDELARQGFYVQQIQLQDPMPIRVAIQIRKEQEEEA